MRAMRASINLGALLATMTAALTAVGAQAQPSQQRQPPQPPVVVIERDRTPPPPARERQINPPRTFQDISPPMQSPTPLSPMAPRVGN